MGIVTTRTISESVFGSQLLKLCRENSLDLDAIAESLHDPSQLPSKQDQPVEFMKPLVNLLVNEMKRIQPAKRQNTALAQVQSLQKELEKAKADLAKYQQHQNKRPGSPTLMQASPKKRSRAQQLPLVFPSSSDALPKELDEPSNESPTASASKPEDTVEVEVEEPEASTEAISQFPPTDHEAGSEPWTTDQILNPHQASLQSKQPTGYSDSTFRKYVQTFPKDTQESANKLLDIILEANLSKEELSIAAQRYGIKADISGRMTIKTLNHLVCLGAAMTA